MARNYDWNLINHMYHEGKYTTTDLHLIFGPVNGHISKKLRIEGEARQRGIKAMQVSPKAFSKELNDKIKQHDGLRQRIEVYYNEVCLPLKAIKVCEYIEAGATTRQIAQKLNIAQSSVVHLSKLMKGKDLKLLREKVKMSKQKFENSLNNSK